jgi:hypothetical protein
VDLLQQPLVVQHLEVAPDGHVRHGQLAGELRDAHGAGLTNPFEDVGLALAGEHVLHSEVARRRLREAQRRCRRYTHHDAASG